MTASPTTLALAVVGAALAQATLMPSAALGAAVPHLPLLFVVSWSLVRGARAGIGWAFVAGLLCDQLSTAPLGTYTLPLVAAALAVAAGAGRFADVLIMPAVFAALATVVFVVGQLAVLAAIGGVVDARPTAVLWLVVPTVLLNLLWLPIVYFPLRWWARVSGPPRLAWER